MASLATAKSNTRLCSNVEDDSEEPNTCLQLDTEHVVNRRAESDAHVEDAILEAIEHLSTCTAASFDLDEYLSAQNADDMDTATDLGIPFAASAYDLNSSLIQSTIRLDPLSYYQVPDLNSIPVHVSPRLNNVPSQYQLPELVDYSALYSSAALRVFKSFHDDVGGSCYAEGTRPTIADSQYVFEMA
ncbi:hypothetical protein AAVH_03401 [Aphelenchoides avenae]|nr:hypothetical protein AAVH_03401 [Aphelenchus avenae]